MVDFFLTTVRLFYGVNSLNEVHQMKRCFVILSILLLSIQLLQAQEILLIEKTNGRRSYEFSEGEKLKLKLKDSGDVLRGSWTYNNRNSLIISGQEVKLSDIRWVDVSEKEPGIYLLRRGQDLLILAGAGYFAISQINHLIETGEFTDDRQVNGVSGALVGGGLLCAAADRILRKRKIPLEGGRFSISLTRPF